MNVEIIWKEYSARLKAFLFSNVSNPDDVEDLLQEILIKTYQHLDDIVEITKVKSWLFQVANNSIIDFYRKKAKDKNLDQGQNQDQDQLWYTEGDKSIYQNLSECILPFIQALPDDEAQMLISIEINGVSQKEYAEKNGMKYSTLKSRVQKSRDKINSLFKECCELSIDGQGNIMDFEPKGQHCKKC
ncbi:MAG: RNA polymerase sigma factor SigZ [Alteromonadaceae bacterium]|nr:RNA polymerase sigma factor SigZ [Alteromonadaceae bacterium]